MLMQPIDTRPIDTQPNETRPTDEGRPSDEQIWRWLEEVPDPEVPVISVVELGIVRTIGWDGDSLVVTVTPTYSGCPATRVINDDIVAHLAERGIDKVRMERRLSPAWTTAWLSDAGRRKLLDYGIAPPIEDGPGCAIGQAAASVVPVRMLGKGDAFVPPPPPPSVTCPRCGTGDAERISQFGSTPCKASYRCRECLEPFDYFKWI